MKLVIDIPKDVYTRLFDNGIQDNEIAVNDVCEMARSLRLGTPLPKGHGDLVDRDAINDRFYNIWQELESYSNKPSYKKLLGRWSMCMDTAPVIINADEEN